MRKQFVRTKYKEKAFEICPWSSFIVRATGGHYCFEGFDDYNEFLINPGKKVKEVYVYKLAT